MRALIFFALPFVALGYYIAIDEGKSPALTMWDGKRVDWSSGAVAALVDTSVAVRVSSRGLHFYDHDVDPLSSPIPCRRAPDCLCYTGDNSSRVFPENDPPRYAYGASQCGTSSAYRVIVSDPSIYDISVCDLVQAQADIIWRRGSIYVDSALHLPDWAYIITALAVLFLVISLGQNIARIMGDEHAVTQPYVTEAVCFGLCVLLMSINSPFRVFVAQHDRVMMVATASYLAIHIARQAFELAFESYVYTFNVITASLMMVTARLYCSFETPYSTIFFVLLLTRLFHKLHAQNINATERFTITTDSLLIALHYRLSYRPSFWDPQAAPIYASAITVLCYTVGALTSYQVRAKPPPKGDKMNERGAIVTKDRGHFPTFRANGSEAWHDALRLDFLH
jgi:hypothetical protein